MNTNFEYKVPENLKALGSSNGYQRLYVEGTAKSEGENTKFSWLNKGKFYSLTTVSNVNDEILFTRIGANDPGFNLRRQAALILRRKNTKNTLFVSAIEAHGSYSPVTESAVNSNSAITALKVVLDSEGYTAIQITDINGNTKLFITANTNAAKEARHNLKINNKDYEWSGPYYFK